MNDQIDTLIKLDNISRYEGFDFKNQWICFSWKSLKIDPETLIS